MRFKSPGVYVKEADVSRSWIPKNQIRKGKISSIFNITNTSPIVKMYAGSTNGVVIANSYEEFKKIFGSTC